MTKGKKKRFQPPLRRRPGQNLKDIKGTTSTSEASTVSNAHDSSQADIGNFDDFEPYSMSPNSSEEFVKKSDVKLSYIWIGVFIFLGSLLLPATWYTSILFSDVSSLKTSRSEVIKDNAGIKKELSGLSLKLVEFSERIDNIDNLVERLLDRLTSPAIEEANKQQKELSLGQGDQTGVN